MSAFRSVKAIETAPPDVQPTAAQATGQPPDAADITAWLLEGRFFTVDPNGAVTVWSPIAADTFGWRRRDIVGEPLGETLTPDVELPLHGGYTGAQRFGEPEHHAAITVLRREQLAQPVADRKVAKLIEVGPHERSQQACPEMPVGVDKPGHADHARAIQHLSTGCAQA